MGQLHRRRLNLPAKNCCGGPPAPASNLPVGPKPLLKVDSSPEKPVRVYADGIYDLFHFGHARSLEQAKKLFPNTYLLVGCCNDEITHMYKGKTVMIAAERYESLRHCRWVDEVIPDAPWVISHEFIDKHQIDYVAHDSLPYADASGAGKDVYEFVKAIGKFKETKRTDGISSSDIIMRILKDYNQYIMRNLARGYTRKDLGVSFVKEKQLRVNMGITKLREKVKEQQEKLHTVAKTAGMHHGEWVENADRWVSVFLEKFEEGCHIMVNFKFIRQVVTSIALRNYRSSRQSKHSLQLDINKRWPALGPKMFHFPSVLSLSLHHFSLSVLELFPLSFYRRLPLKIESKRA